MNMSSNASRNLETPTSSSTASALEAYANETLGALPGARLKFAKGEWTLDGQTVGSGEEFVTVPSSITRAMERWQSKRITDRVVARLGERLVPRSELGDHDRSRWETGLDGRERDPWGEVHYLGLRRLDDNSLVVFSTSSDGGRKAIAQIAKAAASRPGEAPIVTLGSNSYPHRSFGQITTPTFDVAGWEPTAPEASPAPAPVAALAAPKAAVGQESKAAPDRLNDDVDSLFGPMPPLSAYSADDGL